MNKKFASDVVDKPLIFRQNINSVIYKFWIEIAKPKIWFVVVNAGKDVDKAIEIRINCVSRGASRDSFLAEVTNSSNVS